MNSASGLLSHPSPLAFLNIHWFLDKSGKTGSKMQLVFLLSTYIGARLTFGVYNSFSFLKFVFFPPKAHYPPIPVHIWIFYSVGNVILNTLNFIWFRAMVRAVQKRFAPSDKKGGKLDPKKVVKGQQSVDLKIQGDGDEEQEREALIGNHDFSSHGTYSDTESREARWRKVAKKEGA
jgi:hypothetical protein